MEERIELEREGASRPLRAVQDGLDEDGPRVKRPVMEVEDAPSVDFDAFEDDTTRVQWRPYLGATPVVMEVRQTALSPADLKSYYRELRRYKQRLEERERLEDQVSRRKDELSKIKDQTTEAYLDLEADIATDEESLRTLSTDDDVDLTIKRIIMPMLVAWNLKRSGVPIPVDDVEAIKAIPSAYLAGINKTIMEVVNGTTGGKRKRSKKRRT